jgi:hypothetical protein
MQKFSDFVKAQKKQQAESVKESAAAEFNKAYEAKLQEYGVKSPIELNEAQSKEFYEYLQTLKTATKSAPVNEADVKDEKSFREYAESVLKKAHGDDYDQKIADKVIDGIVSKVEGDDWGAAVGRLTSGLGK